MEEKLSIQLWDDCSSLSRSGLVVLTTERRERFLIDFFVYFSHSPYKCGFFQGNDIHFCENTFAHILIIREAEYRRSRKNLTLLLILK